MTELNVTKIEEEILRFWQKNKVFEKSLANRRGRKKFIFYEGPPFANGLPHIGHLLTRVFKDLFLRYKTMRGFYVPRKAGWDTHGLPVELEVEKEIGVRKKSDIEKYGMDKFIKKAKENVFKYKTEWEKFTERIGFWLDLDNAYITYSNDYIESLWWVVKEFDRRRLLYQDLKVVPLCPRCSTSLSSHELALGYKKIKEDSIYVKFEAKESSIVNFKSPAYFLVWTTTPWTLPSNEALAVNPEIDYVAVETDSEVFILAKERLKVLDKSYRIIKKFNGKDLVGIEYKPLFNFQNYSPFRIQNSKFQFRILPADFVMIDEGTGIVHIAPAFGEEDFRLSKTYNLPVFNPVTEDGKFTSLISSWKDKFVKDADHLIIEDLKLRNLIFKIEPYEHDYPFCWRCETPLLYYATKSWFVSVSKLRKKLLANNKKINWFPEYIKEGRFGQWLKEVKDWAFSRKRFWGTPLPIWRCKNCEKYLVIGSTNDLEKYRYRESNEYYILRHGESEKNFPKEIINSKLEFDKYNLTKKGEGQIKKVAKALKNEGGVDLIFSSPFLRARQSAEIISKELGIGFKIDERLKEFDHGSVCEGNSDHGVLSEDYPHKDFNIKLGNGESWRDMGKRIFDFIKELEMRYQGKRILIVSHGDPLWLLGGSLNGLTEKELIETKLKRTKSSKSYIKLGEIKKINIRNLPYDEIGRLDLHRPWIDQIILKCPKCNGQAKRVPEVIDVWFDSGAMPFAQENFPFSCYRKSKLKIKNYKSLLKKFIDFPADFICEAVDQTRGWFYTLLAVSTLLGFGPPYKNVLTLGLVLDEKGEKLSKSKGAGVGLWNILNSYGVDPIRWYFYRVNPAGESKKFKEDDLREIIGGFFRVILNSLRFFKLYSKKQKNKLKINFNKLRILDKWIFSRFNSLVDLVSKSLDRYDVTLASREIEKFAIEDLSNWWIRLSRTDFQLSKNLIIQRILGYILFELSKLIAPFTPFLAEYLYLNLKSNFRDINNKISVHINDWPELNKRLINKGLEKQIDLIKKITAIALSLRKKAQIKVRQPLPWLKFYIKEKSAPKKINKELLNLIKDELNVKDVFQITDKKPKAKGPKEIEISQYNIIVILNTEINKELRGEGWVRELIRIIQDARKEVEYQYDQKIKAFWFSNDDDLNETIERNLVIIKKKALLKELKKFPDSGKEKFDIEKEMYLEPQRKIWFGLRAK